jgi:hypothetical protein
MNFQKNRSALHAPDVTMPNGNFSRALSRSHSDICNQWETSHIYQCTAQHTILNCWKNGSKQNGCKENCPIIIGILV